MDLYLPLIGITLGAAIALATVYVFQRSLAVRRIASARVVADTGGSLGMQPRSALRAERRSLPLVDLLPLSSAGRERTEWALERAGVPLRVSEFVALRASSAFGGLIAAAGTAGIFGLPLPLLLLASVGAMLAGWALPGMWVARKREQRVEAIDAQLPVALTTLAKSLRAGSGLLQALAYTADETPAPLGPELQQTLRQLHLGANPEDAFAQLSARVGSSDLDIAVTAIIIQRTVGGNLSEILSNVAATIRERAKIYAELKVLTSRQRLTGNLMALIPVGIALLFIVGNPDMGRVLIDTGVGQIALGVGLAFELLGLLLIRKLGQIEV